MIFHFPNLETLRLTLSSGQVPPAVSLAAAEVAFDPAGSPSVEPGMLPPKPMLNAFKRLGIKTAKTHHGEPRNVASWLEIVPLEREPGSPELGATVPVLFEMPVSQLATLATEMLRLGNDRQSFRYLKTLGSSLPANDKVLLRVIGPPYYTLLRALDHHDPDVAAYVERAPGVWIAAGFTHPLAPQMKVPEERILLLRPPNFWITLDDGPFQDIYSILDFQLPQAAVDFAEGKLAEKLTVPLRLMPGNAAELPEMWLLRDNAIEVFDAFVRDADDRLMARLLFAVAENGETGPAVILRTRPSKLSPPAIELPGSVGYVPFRRMNNLFLPVGTRLQPTLRRDAVRTLLANDPAEIVWLAALGEGRFAPETLPDEAFRPLQDWVDYVIDHEREPLQSWVQATRFDFESFVCKGDFPDDRAPPPLRKKERAKNQDAEDRPVPAEPTLAKEKTSTEPLSRRSIEGFVAPTPPNELKIERETLEQEFLALEGSLESPERQVLWPRLALVNVGLNDLAEASVCWLHALWERNDLPAEWLQSWLKSEEKSANCDLTKSDIDRELAIATPSQGDMRRLAVKLLLACTRRPIPAVIKERLPEIRRHLEKHEESLGIRAVWLVWLHLSNGGDVLGLARVRDRLVDRLLQAGLKPQYDVANFIRFAGQPDCNRLRRVQDHLLQFRGEVHTWLTRQSNSLTATGWYADLIIAYGLGKIGEDRHSGDFASAALAKLRSTTTTGKPDEIHLFLADAFEYRIRQAAKNSPIGPLPTHVLKSLDGMDPGPLSTVNQLRKQLRILEPHEKSDPYLVWKKQSESTLPIELAALPLIGDPKKLQLEIKRIWNNGRKSSNPQDRLTILIETIPLTTRIGEAFASEMFAHVLPALTPTRANVKGPPTDKTEIELHARLIDAAVPIAANYGWTESLRQILTRFVDNLRLLDELSVVDSINLALGQWLRSLRKCGLKDRLESLLKDLTDLLIKGRTFEKLRNDYSSESTRKNWVDVLRSLLHLSECWVYFGWQARALPFIEEARRYLFDNRDANAKSRPIATRYAALTSSYIRAVGQNGDFDFAAARYRELLEKMDVLPNTTTTGNYYSGMHLGIVEEIVLALVSDDFILGEAARRWLDDDEYLVRRRIHGDMRDQLSQSGV